MTSETKQLFLRLLKLPLRCYLRLRFELERHLVELPGELQRDIVTMIQQGDAGASILLGRFPDQKQPPELKALRERECGPHDQSPDCEFSYLPHFKAMVTLLILPVKRLPCAV